MNFYGIVPRFLSGAVKCEESARQRSLLAEHGCNLAMSHRLPNYRIIRAAHSFRPRLIASSRDLIYLQCSSVSLVCLIPPSQSLSLSLPLSTLLQEDHRVASEILAILAWLVCSIMFLMRSVSLIRSFGPIARSFIRWKARNAAGTGCEEGTNTATR